LATAEAAHSLEDNLYGSDKPEWVADKKKRAEKIRAAKAELEAEAKARHRGQSQGRGRR
jgi:hypothetical protein